MFHYLRTQGVYLEDICYLKILIQLSAPVVVRYRKSRKCRSGIGEKMFVLIKSQGKFEAPLSQQYSITF